MTTSVLITAVAFLAGVVAFSAAVPTMTTTPSGCIYKDTWYPEGNFRHSPCEPCMCHGGRVSCAIVDCFFTLCVDSVQDADHCCPVCPNGPNCRAPDGQIISVGEEHHINDYTVCTCPQHGFMGNHMAACAIKDPRPTAHIVN